MLKKALFNETNVPKGGTCLSSFLVLKDKGGLLVGKMARPEVWVERFLVGEMFASHYVASNKWVIPASHLKYGENPEDAATRILTEQVGAKKSRLKLLQVQSHLSQTPNDPESAHWDICFVHGGTLKAVEKPEWFSELKFVKPKDLKSDDFTRGHGDILRQLGIIKQ